MIGRSLVRFGFAMIALIFCIAGQAFAQGTLRRPMPESETRDSSGNLKGPDTVPASEASVRGEVLLADGSVPDELVEIYVSCNGFRNLVATANSKGRFSFNPDILGNTLQNGNCMLRASLPGYRSDPKALVKSGENVGKLILQPLSSDPKGVVSNTDHEASKSEKKLYEKALNQAASGDWRNASASLQKATDASPGFSSAWLTLGLLQSNHGDPAGAEKSFLASIHADQTFALPLIEAATLEAAHGNWPAVLDHSAKAITLNANAFPGAYALNAMANVSLQNIDAAEKSAREGLKLDTAHQYPELEYSLGIVLYSKGDLSGALDHLYSYLKSAPDGPNASAARKQLAQIKTAAGARWPADTAKDENFPAAKAVGTNETGPSTALLQERNAPLLVKTPAYTCLETISRRQADTRGRIQDADLMRVDIAVSDGNEIYGYADGKRFSNERLADMLGYTFSTTGLFSSIARALIAGNDEDIVFAGKETPDGESVLRYNFRVLPGHGGWSIDHGKESGTAGERGWFLVDSANLMLRSVVVYAVDIPRSLKLKELDATIDYEPETIAGNRVLLPYVARVHVQEASGKERDSRMFFNHCRAFTSEATLSFGADNTRVQNDNPSGRLELPPGLNITVALSGPLNPANSDVVMASVMSPVFSRGREIIAQGAALEGHIHADSGENSVTIELDRVRTRDGWVPFYARLISPATANSARAEGKNAADPEIPGVARIKVSGTPAELPAGMQMIWKTESLVKPVEASAPQLNTAVSLY